MVQIGEGIEKDSGCTHFFENRWWLADEEAGGVFGESGYVKGIEDGIIL